MTEPKYKLYSPTQITWAVFLGSPVAGCWFIAHNYRKLNQSKKANQTIIWGVLGTFMLMAISYFSPHGLGGIGIVFLWIFWNAAVKEFRNAIENHKSKDGKLGSWWTVIGISILCLFCLLVISFIVGFILALFGVVR